MSGPTYTVGPRPSFQQVASFIIHHKENDDLSTKLAEVESSCQKCVEESRRLSLEKLFTKIEGALRTSAVVQRIDAGFRFCRIRAITDIGQEFEAFGRLLLVAGIYVAACQSS